jgi:hypothetical protein
MQSDQKEMHVLSLGAGVQSSALALMAAKGELEYMPDCAVFADTQSEPESVYKWLEWLQNQLPFPIHKVSQGNLYEDSLKLFKSKNGNDYMIGSIPAYIVNEKGQKGIMMRQCTSNYKIKPIYSFIKKKYKKTKINMWLGISLDEVQRMKPSRDKWIKNVYPLIDKGMTRLSCLNWMEYNKYPTPPRSSCIFCPYHNDNEWKKLKEEEPDQFQKAVEYEKKYQEQTRSILEGVPYLHNSLKPLDEIDFNSNRQVDLFNNECEGMCGI